MPEGWKSADLAIVRALMLIVIAGFILVGFALLLLRWPIGAGDQSVQQLARLAGSSDSGQTLLQRLPDLAIYLIVIAGIAFLALALRRGERSLLLGLMGVGFLGLAYAGGMALYIGPMVSVCGFTLIVFGGMVAWATTGPRDTADITEAAEPAEAAAEAAASAENAEYAARFQPPEITELRETPDTNQTGEITSADNQAPGDVSGSERVEPE